VSVSTLVDGVPFTLSDGFPVSLSGTLYWTVPRSRT